MQRRHFMVLAGGLAIPAAASAQPGFPTRPLRMIIPFAAAGSTDILARLSCQILTTALGQPVVPENVTGAGGVIGAQRVIGAPADGYMLLAGTPGPIIINPVLLPHIEYDSMKDLTGVAFVGDSPAVIVVRQDSPIRTVKQLIEEAKASPGKLSFATAGVGSFGHLSAELFQWRAGIALTHLPYRGSAPAIIDLLGGRADLMVENYPSVEGNLESNQLRAIAVGTRTPSPFLPGVPTVIESGVPDYESASWFGLLARSGTPPAAIERINAAINDGLTKPAVRETLAKLGVAPVGGTPQAFNQFLAGKMAEMKQLAQATHIQLQ